MFIFASAGSKTRRAIQSLQSTLEEAEGDWTRASEAWVSEASELRGVLRGSGVNVGT